MARNQLQPSSFKKMESGLFLCFCALFIASSAFWIWIFKNQLPAVTDLFLDIYPNKVFNIDQFRQGIIPLWNSWVGCGIPQLASWQSSCFYPFFWIWNLLGTPDSIPIVCVLHSGMACLGFFLWMRSQKNSLISSFLGALSFAGSALFIRCWAYPHHIAALTWIPWIFWSVNRGLKKNRSLDRWLPALFLSLQILGGYPIFVFYTWLILILWVFFQKPFGKDFRWLAVQLLMAIGITSLQWMPFGEFLTYCGRGGWWKEFPYFDRPLDYLTLLNPGLLGTPGSTDYQGTTANFVFNLYFGAVAFLVWLCGCFSAVLKKYSRNIFWEVTSVILLFWMAGSHFFILKVIPEKILDWLEPSKAVSLFIFAASTVAAFQFQAWSIRRRKILTFYGLTALSLLWFFDILIVPFQLVHPIPNLFQQPEIKKKAFQIKKIVQNERILSLIQEKQLAFTGPDRVEKSVEEPASYFLSNSNGAWKIPSVDFYLSIWVKSTHNLLVYCSKGFPYKGDLLNIAGVRLFLLPQELLSPQYQTIGKWKNDFLILNSRASANLRWVGQSLDFPDAPAILNILAQPKSGWRQKVYLEKNSIGDYFSLSPAQRFIRIKTNENNQISNSSRISLNSIFPKPGYVIFNDSYAPGWHAWVDGKPEPILRAYGLFMAVPLEGGPHQVDFRYEPTSFRLGAFISLLSLGLLGFLALARRP